MNFLPGAKTFLVALLFVILAGLKAKGYIDENMYQSLMALLAAAGLATMRMGITNEVAKINPPSA